MTLVTKDPRRADAPDVRRYIQGMLIELAQMADAVGDRDLARRMRDLSDLSGGLKARTEAAFRP